MNLEQIKNVLKNSHSIKNHEILKTDLCILKKEAIAKKDESKANEIWCLENINEIQLLFINAFNNLKKRKYYEAWNDFSNIDIKLIYFRKHQVYYTDEYNILYIEEYARKFEKLFPYRLFVSRETIVKKQKCSICNSEISIRKSCSHTLGELYMGEMCSRKIVESQIIGAAIVEDPFDKYSVIFPQDLEYNYGILEELLNRLETPYEKWDLTVTKRIGEKFINARRNGLCPCGSEKKYKKCCKNTQKELINHYDIKLNQNKGNNPILRYKEFGTWK